MPGQDIVATCAACWLGGRETLEKLDASSELLADINEALKEAGLDGHIIQPKKLQEIAVKAVSGKR
ncbi:MAG: hypothetical protein ACTS6J_10650 [Burkholderiales bacterium]